VFPRFVPFSNCVSDEAADVTEYIGSVILDVLHELIVRATGQVLMEGEPSVGTVNVEVQVVVVGAQLLVYIKVTEEAPPHALGVPGLLLLNTPLVQPPPAFAVPNHVA
jgi:hypothetical protein